MRRAQVWGRSRRASRVAVVFAAVVVCCLGPPATAVAAEPASATSPVPAAVPAARTTQLDPGTQPIAGLACIDWHGAVPDRPDDPNVTAQCLYAEWRLGKFFPEVAVVGSATRNKLLAVPSRPLQFLGCVAEAPNSVDLANGGWYCRFADPAGVLDMLVQAEPNGPFVSDLVVSARTACPSRATFAAGAGVRAQPTVFRNGTWFVNALAPEGIRFGQAGDLACAADFDPDGIDDLAVFRPATGEWFVRRHAESGIRFGNAYAAGSPVLAADVPVVADVTGDAIADLAVFRAGVWFVRGVAPQGIAYGNDGDVAVPADYDGDGRAELAVYRPSDGRFYVRGLFDAGVAFGKVTPHPWAPTRGSLAAVADYDGDGRADFGVLDRDTGAFRVDTNRDGAAELVVAPGSFVAGYDEPAAADFNGDGAAEPATFDTYAGLWRLSVAPQYWFGSGGDVAVP